MLAFALARFCSTCSCIIFSKQWLKRTHSNNSCYSNIGDVIVFEQRDIGLDTVNKRFY